MRVYEEEKRINLELKSVVWLQKSIRQSKLRQSEEKGGGGGSRGLGSRSASGLHSVCTLSFALGLMTKFSGLFGFIIRQICGAVRPQGCQFSTRNAEQERADVQPNENALLLNFAEFGGWKSGNTIIRWIVKRVRCRWVLP